MKLTLTRGRVALLALAVATAVVGASYAAIPGSNGVISACRDVQGKLKVIDAEAGQACPGGQTPLSWNQKGPAGPPGPSGVVKALAFAAGFSPAMLPGNFGNTIVTPAACRTEAYIAGPGESAFLTLSAMGSPSLNVNDVMYIAAMASVNGGTFASLHPKMNSTEYTDMAESLADGTASASVNRVVPLQAGKSYVFGAGFASNNQVTINPGYCYGSVLILKTAA
jgi:hypothetical protein